MCRCRLAKCWHGVICILTLDEWYEHLSAFLARESQEAENVAESWQGSEFVQVPSLGVSRRLGLAECCNLPD